MVDGHVLGSVRRQRGLDRAESESSDTKPVALEMAPAMTIDAAMMLPTSTAIRSPEARSLDSSHRARLGRSSFTKTTLPERTVLYRRPVLVSMSIAAHTRGTVGGGLRSAHRRPPEASVLPPRIIPP